ncbi:hypothetical protein VE03_10757 [Pseudogymnoascus sp. 23342-1-I1]|nr:hypothetical protein VE03_10757 [Pseudogymnoascus sp. 23342-1-I1]
MKRVDFGQMLVFEVNDEDDDYSSRKEELREWALRDLMSYGKLADVVIDVNANQLDLAAYFPKGFTMKEGQHEELLAKFRKEVLRTSEQDESAMRAVEYNCAFYRCEGSMKDIMAEDGFEVGPENDLRVEGCWQYGLTIRSRRESKLQDDSPAWFCTLYFEQYVASNS